MKGSPLHAADPGQRQGGSGGRWERIRVGWDLHRPLIHRAGGTGTCGSNTLMGVLLFMFWAFASLTQTAHQCSQLAVRHALPCLLALELGHDLLCLPLCAAATASRPPMAAATLKPACWQLHLGKVCGKPSACLISGSPSRQPSTRMQQRNFSIPLPAAASSCIGLVCAAEGWPVPSGTATQESLQLPVSVCRCSWTVPPPHLCLHC